MGKLIALYWTRLVPDALRSLTAKPSRTAAMTLGILLGVAGAAGALTIADCQQATVLYRFDLQRSNYVSINIQNENGIDEDIARELRTADGIINSGELTVWQPRLELWTGATAGNLTTVVTAANAGGLAAAQVQSVSGAPIEALSDIKGNAVWVGKDLANRLHWSMEHPRLVVLGGQLVSVAGIVEAPDGFGYINQGVVTSRATAEHVSGPSGPPVWMAHVRPGSAETIGERAAQLFRSTGGDQVELINNKDGELLASSVGTDLRLLGIGLGAVVGTISMFAVANTLMMSVAQRSGELGLRAAMGWSRRRLSLLILTEALLCGFIASVLGLGLASVIMLIWSAWAGGVMVVSPLTFLCIATGGLLASLLGGILPAQQAAKMSPLEAMRS